MLKLADVHFSRMLFILELSPSIIATALGLN